MSKLSSKRKPYRKKRKKIIDTNPATRIYTSLKKDHGPEKVPIELNDEKFLPLMIRVIEGNLPISKLITMAKQSNFHGTLQELLGEDNYGIPVILNLEYVSTSEAYYPVLEGLGISNKYGLQVYQMDGHGRPLLTLYGSKPLYCKIIRIEKLPADMRKWTENQRLRFMQAKTDRIQESDVGDPSKIARHFITSPVGEKLHQIRRRNGYPSKAQKRRIVRESISLRKYKIDGSFSLDQ